MECFEHVILKIQIRLRTMRCSTIKVPCCCSGTQGVPARRVEVSSQAGSISPRIYQTRMERNGIAQRVTELLS